MSTNRPRDISDWRILQSASDLTLAIRLKNDLAMSEDDKICEVSLVTKIVNRFFNGTETAHVDDIPMWAAVHSISYYCATSSLAARILHNWWLQAESNFPKMTDYDFNRLDEAMKQCARKLPELEANKEQGWNVYFAETIDPRGEFAQDRQARLLAMREWLSWSNDPYDEQSGSESVPHARRGRQYYFSAENSVEEFSTPD